MYLSRILTFDFVHKVYSFAKNENFIITSECFRIIFLLIESPHVELVSSFLEANADEFSKMFIKFCEQSKNQNDDQLYFIKRETLILIHKLLENPNFEGFSNKYTNNAENLKMIMNLLNNKSHKIIAHAIDVLHYFFLDVENKDNQIKKILHTNKKNFYIFFDKIEDILSNDHDFSHDNPDLSSKKNFILYELERLENYLDE